MSFAAEAGAPAGSAEAAGAAPAADDLGTLCRIAREKDWYCSPVPRSCLGGAPVVLGIDEAGRGPVLGDMTYGCAYWPADRNKAIGDEGYDDSKALSAEKREGFFEAINKHPDIGYVLRVISAEEISNSMLQVSPRSLNKLSHQAAVDLIQHVLDRGVNLTEVFVDTVGDPDRYQEYLNNVFHRRIRFTVTSKADSLFPVVSAASIVAKVARDFLLSHWKFREKRCAAREHEFGCGYPGDKTTKEWLLANMDKTFGFPNIVRFSWQTSKTLLEDKANRVDWFDDDEQDALQPKLSFAAPPKKRKRASYFRSNAIRTVTTF